MKIEFDEIAEFEYHTAYIWYENQRLGLGLEFENCVEAAIGLLLRFPTIGSLISNDTRRMLVRRFPYGLYYRVNGALIETIGVRHFKQKPKFLKVV